MSSQFKITTRRRSILADTTTPVAIYLRLRDVFPNALLLESADYHSRENSMSYICLEPVAGLRVEDGIYSEHFPGGERNTARLTGLELQHLISKFCSRFQDDPDITFQYISGGLFGYMNYDCVQYFEDIQLKNVLDADRKIPELVYHVYRYVIAINHFKNELHVFGHQFSEINDEMVDLEKLCNLIQIKDFGSFHFQKTGPEESNFNDADFLNGIAHVKEHIQRGDIFQMQLSRRFSQHFKGDDFNLYRALRSINPSPYLFYFDYGSYRIIGSSPETQISIKNGVAHINPIAGTFKRSGDDKQDQLLAEKLIADPKENAEHVMLVDLARNDLSRHCDHVQVEKYKDVQFYSHVIHLVSRVSGRLKKKSTPMEIVADTFPAGTLSGAPKYRTLELIDQYERGARGIYGGAIGHMGFNGDFNHAILIRSFLSKNNLLHYQAAGGIVADSIDENELNEVHNKLMALKKAIEFAEKI